MLALLNKIYWRKLFVIASLSILVACSDQPDIKAMTNIKGYTFDHQGKLIQFDTLVWQLDKVVGVGSDTLLQQFPDAEIQSLEGKFVLPGLIDAHGHVLGLGLNLMQVDLRGSKSQLDAVKRIQTFLAENNLDKNSTSDQWIVGRGWNQVLWEDKKFPTKQILDQYFPNQPVMLERVDGHAIWVNSKALSLAAITRDLTSPPGGEIVKDENGEPTGVLIDTAMDPVFGIMPAPDLQTYGQALELAEKHLTSLGLTSVHDAGIDYLTWQLFQQEANAKELKVRIYAMLSATDPKFDEMLNTGYVADEQGFLSVRSVKAYGDGALGSRGAALIHPYHDDPANSGLLVTSEADLAALVDKVLAKDFQMNIHAIGDRSNKIVLDQFERNQKPDLRPRVEHAQVVQPTDIPRFAKLGVIPSMQPTHATSDMNMAEDRIGKERLRGAYAWQTFLNTGSRIAAGSDFPVELANPFHGLYSAVTRMDHKQQPIGGWIPEEALSLEQALKAFTLDAAYAAHQEDMIGSLEVGKKADFIVIDRDIFESPIGNLWQTQVKETWINGKKVN